MPQPSRQVLVTWSHALDMANFMNVLTGDPFYVDRHAEAHGLWAPRLSEAARKAIDGAVALRGSTMLGPYLSYVVSAVPGFETMSLADLLAQPAERFEAVPDYRQKWEQAPALLQSLRPVAEELEALGFRAYWEAERLPLITQAAEQMERSLTALPLDLGQAVREMLGAEPAGSDQPVQLFLCTFASPHGMRITGKRFVSDVTYSPTLTLRVAIHEMFHPPYDWQEVAREGEALIRDPLFQHSFQTLHPKFGYSTEQGFLEENVVEAMELHVSRQSGLIDDPIGYLLEHDEGSHRLSVVLLRYFAEVPRIPGERFGQYFRRLVGAMPVGQLQGVYDAEITAHAAG